MGRSEGRLQLGFCHSSGHETTTLSLGEQREQKRSKGRLPGVLADVACGLAGVSTGVGGCDTAMCWGGKVRRRWSVGYTKDVGKYEGSLQLVFLCSAWNKTQGLGLGEKRERNLFVTVF